MVSSLPNLVDNLVDFEGVHKIKRKLEHDNEKHEKHGIKYKDCECVLEHTNVKDDLIIYNCL